MKFLKKLLSLCSIVVISSCSNEVQTNDKNTNNESDSLALDTLFSDTLILLEPDPNRVEIDVAALIAKSEETFELPLMIDSSFIEKYALQEEDADYNLTSVEAKYLGFSFPEGDLVSGGGWRLNTFIEIDSIKKAGGYEEYLNNLDLGQARYCIGHVIGKVDFNSQSTLLIWNLDYATYEACPYGYGTYIFGTIFTNGVGTNTCMLAESSGGGDPPSWGESYMQSEIVDTNITVTNLDTWGEDGDNGEDDYVETQDRTEILSISSLGFKVIKKGGDYSY